MGARKLNKTYHTGVSPLKLVFSSKRHLEQNSFSLKKCINTYPYGFNGMERDDEVKGAGNSYDFGARMHDSRLGRWLSIDKKWKMFSNLSTYQFASLNPIYYKDSDGNVIEPTTEAKSSYNQAVANVFSGNDVVINMLQISDDQKTLQNLSMEDYNKAMGSLNTVDQRAAFRGMYLAANDETVYKIQVVGSDETATLNGKQYKGSQINEGVGIASQDPIENEVGPSIVDIAINEDKAGTVKDGSGSVLLDGLLLRDKDAMIIGGIISAYATNQEGEYVPQPETNTPQGIVQVQSENIIMRIKHGREMYGSSFMGPPEPGGNGKGQYFSGKDSEKASLLPPQISLEYAHFTSGVELWNMVVDKPKKIDFDNGRQPIENEYIDLE